MWARVSDEDMRLRKIEERLLNIEQTLNGFDNCEKTRHYFGLKAQVRALMHHFKLRALSADIPSFDDFATPQLEKYAED